MSHLQDELYSREHTALKKPYETPGITTFGSVAKLTQGQNGTHWDVGQNNYSKKGAGVA